MATKNPEIRSRVTPEVYAKLEKLAGLYGCSVYNLVQVVLNRHVEYVEIKGDIPLNDDDKLCVIPIVVSDKVYNILEDIAWRNDKEVGEVARNAIYYTLGTKKKQI